jgi:1-piperideine-2-carboxylate/1-pyrroline-2-carboxylate reductase [NAD(P)H]
MATNELKKSVTDNESTTVFGAVQTAELLPYGLLADEIARVLIDPRVQVPARLVQPLAGGGSLFVMPASDEKVAITKLITYTPSNLQLDRDRRLPAIQGDVVVFNVHNGSRKILLDGPTVTARRTAAVSLLAARSLASQPQGRLLIVGAGVQGRAHLEAFSQGLGTREVVIASRSITSAEALAAYARTLGIEAQITTSPNQALFDCPIVVTCTPANTIVLSAVPRPDTFIAAVGAFTPKMIELSKEFCCYFYDRGRIVVDTADACHEAGDLIQAQLDVSKLKTLAEVVRTPSVRNGAVLFKSCGWAGWDLAAARLALFRLNRGYSI